MLVRPPCLTFCKLVTVCRRWGWICYFGDKVRGGRLGNTINENSEQRNLEEDVEADTEPEEKTFPIAEPTSLLLLGEADTCKVRLELWKYKVSAGA